MRQLYVYFNDTKAGLLTELHPGRGYVFRYDADYLRSSLPAISVTLPKRAEPYEAEYLFPLFTNMIPEGGNRRIICRDLHIDERDFFGILSAMAGADFIGAVNVRKIHDET
jgi:serine/threonine-protein kinase HipA